MIGLLLSFFLGFSGFVSAEGPQTFKVTPFLQSEAFVTQRLLPFMVTDQNDEKVDVQSVKVTGCDGFVDPFRKHIIQIYCPTATFVKVSLVVRANEKDHALRIPDFSVRKVALVSSHPEPTDPTDPGQQPGKTLFQNNCKSCHTSPTPLPSKVSTAQLKKVFLWSFNGKDDSGKPYTTGMFGFHNKFNDQELQHIVDYINGGLK